MKKFVIQIVVLLIAVMGGLLTVFSPASLGLPSIVPGGGIPGGTTTVAPTSAATKQQILFIAAESTGDPELVRGIITVDVADDPAERAQGLSFRESMGETEGMLFVFEQAFIPRFIMREMKFPLDFVWVNGGEIVDLLENIPAEAPGTPDDQMKTYSPSRNSDKVIELNSGYIKKYGLKVGDRIRIEALPLEQVESAI